MSNASIEQLPIRFDPQTFADQETQLHGWVGVKNMQRLHSNVISTDNEAITSLKLKRGLFGYPQAVGEVKLNVTMRCERCLESVDISLASEIEVLLKPMQDHLPDAPESTEETPDIYEYEGNLLKLSDLIEEELLLAMPLVPRHEDISLCNQDMVAWLASNEGPEADAKRADNPFAILKR